MKHSKVLLSLAIVLSVFALLLLVIPAEAQAATEGVYTYSVVNETATIQEVASTVSGALTVPAKLGGYPVTKIGYRAFSNCQKLTSVTLPKGLITVGSDAFHGCGNLSSVTLPSSLKTIESSAFSSCGKLTKLTIPNGVTSIGAYAFRGCWNLASITFPNTLVTVREEAFENTAWLKAQPDGVVYAGNLLFMVKGTCPNKVTVKDGTTRIGFGAFSGCNNLTSITLPNSLKVIDGNAFYQCYKLTSITIPSGVTAISKTAFHHKLTSFVVSSSNAYYSSDSKGVLFNKNKTELILAPGGITGSYTIPSSVKTIGDQAFAGCYKMTNITIPSSVTSIGSYAFESCSGLTKVKIPNSVTELGYSAFESCKGLTSATLSSSIRVISGYAFAYCDNLASVTIPEGVTTIERQAFYSCALTSITIPNSVTSIDRIAFKGCGKLAYVTIPDSVTTIGYEAFHNTLWFNNQPDGLVYAGKVLYAVKGTCPASVSIKSGTVGIAESIFIDCKELTAITFPESLLTIGENAFRGCENLKTITLPGKLSTIGVSAFEGCSGLTSVTIPNSVTSLEGSAFAWCSNLKTVSVSSGITKIESSTFYGCPKLASITIPGKVTEIAYSAFTGCSALKAVTVPTSLVSVHENAFSGCDVDTVFYQGTQTQWKNVTDKAAFGSAEIIFKGFYHKDGETYYGENGKKVTGWKTISGKKHYFKSPDGAMAKGWTSIGGKIYYFKKADGVMVTGVVTIAGEQHQFSSTGVWQKQIIPLAITKQPASVWVAKGKTATVSVTATGEGLKYTWYVLNPGASKYVKSSITKSSYSFTMSDDKNGRKVYCIVTDADGKEVKSNTVTMKIGTVKITKQPVSVKAAKNKMATVTVTATGEGLKYTWYVLNPGASSYVKSSITKSSYAFTMTADKSGRKVYCVVSDKYGQTVKTATVTMSMAAAPKITQQPVSVKAGKNKMATVTVTASGEGLKYTWYVLNPGASSYVKSSITKSSYAFTMTADKSGRKVYCVVTDKYGQTVKSSTVTMSMAAAPKITTQPVSVKAGKDKMATVTVTASGEGLKYTWYVLNPGASSYVKSSITKSSYAFTMTADKSGRKVYCVVSDKYGQTVKTATVTMSMAAAPKITQQPVSVKAGKDKMATVTVTATGEGLKYTWYVLNPGASSYVKSSITKSSYAFTMTADKSGRKVYCVVTDKYGQTVKSSTVTMSMK